MPPGTPSTGIADSSIATPPIGRARTRRFGRVTGLVWRVSPGGGPSAFEQQADGAAASNAASASHRTFPIILKFYYGTIAL